MLTQCWQTYEDVRGKKSKHTIGLSCKTEYNEIVCGTIT